MLILSAAFISFLLLSSAISLLLIAAAFVLLLSLASVSAGEGRRRSGLESLSWRVAWPGLLPALEALKGVPVWGAGGVAPGLNLTRPEAESESESELEYQLSLWEGGGSSLSDSAHVSTLRLLGLPLAGLFWRRPVGGRGRCCCCRRVDSCSPSQRASSSRSNLSTQASASDQTDSRARRWEASRSAAAMEDRSKWAEEGRLPW